MKHGGPARTAYWLYDLEIWLQPINVSISRASPQISKKNIGLTKCSEKKPIETLHSCARAQAHTSHASEAKLAATMTSLQLPP